tara:strand:- start:32 stop:385 length:354 start_codon:yes stop_codon:yes gene_type:complete
MSSLVVGKAYDFGYIKNVVKDDSTCYGRPTLVDYSKNAETYGGTITSVRDISDEPLSSATITYNKAIKGERSQKLYTVELDNGDVKAFYGGRIVQAVQRVVKQPLLRKLVNKLAKSA